MSEKPSPEQIAKLPQWVQNHIKNLERERGDAVKALNQHLDSQTPSKIYWERYLSTGEAEKGPSLKRYYAQTDHLVVESCGVLLRVGANENDAQHNAGIELKWEDQHGIGNMIAAVPKSFQQMDLVAHHNMRVHKVTQARCKNQGHNFREVKRCNNCGFVV